PFGSAGSVFGWGADGREPVCAGWVFCSAPEASGYVVTGCGDAESGVAPLSLFDEACDGSATTGCCGAVCGWPFCCACAGGLAVDCAFSAVAVGCGAELCVAD